MPRTPEGTPDLQGNWTNATVTPLERPPGQPAALSPDVVAKIEKGVKDRIERLAAPSDPNRPAPPQGGDGSTGAAGNVGGYNNFWIDAGERVAIVNGEHRTSLIVDPPDGRRAGPHRRRPRARQAERAKRAAQFGAVRQPREPAAGRALHRCRSDRTPGRRCCPTTSTTTTTRSCRRSDHVMIMTEMVHDARIIRLGNDRRAPAGAKCGRGGATRSAGGRATRWSSRPRTSTRSQIFRGASDTLKVTERLHASRRATRCSTSSPSTTRRRSPRPGAAKCRSRSSTS